ncbi:DUF2397 family protein [Arthrobacter sp. efr-133-TYG-104]|uniref:DUF2397 family protein n=1 Tax=Arthrobacter sp. efr-133-TYG-104 TaxID=3040324 RepID=UPI0025505608|nr:DUF2397 family protein [Arthrobacter sp. efr-133-TYG-104]
MSRRADLLRLAQWFDASDTETSHRIFNAAFGAYPSRHLLRGPDEDNGQDGPTTSWWDAEPVDVPLSLRERGDRAARGRASRVMDPGLEREALLNEAQQEAERLEAATAELIASGNLNGARLSPAADPFGHRGGTCDANRPHKVAPLLQLATADFEVVDTDLGTGALKRPLRLTCR